LNELVLLKDLSGRLPGMTYRCRADLERTMEYLSYECSSLTGYPPEDLQNNCKTSYASLIHKDDRQRVWAQIQSGLQKNQLFQVAYRMHTAQGEEKWVWEQGRLASVSDTGVKYLEGFITDISAPVASEKRLVEAEWTLRQGEENFRKIFEANPIPMLISRQSDSQLLQANQALLDLIGAPSEGLPLPKALDFYANPQDR
jgi:PAS domain S-box-containing protein